MSSVPGGARGSGESSVADGGVARGGVTGRRLELPVDRRVTAEALASYAAPRSSSGFPLLAVVRGALVAWLALPVWSIVVLVAGSLLDAVRTGGPGLDALGLGAGGLASSGIVALVVLVYSMVPAGALGVPLGAALVWVLGRVRRQAWHLASFLGLGAVVGLLGSLVVSLLGFPFLVPATALASATGWFVLRRRLVGWRGDVAVDE